MDLKQLKTTYRNLVKEWHPVKFPAGHEKDNRALIFGRTVDLKINSYESTVVFED